MAFDTVGGGVTTETFRVMAFNGRHLVIGFASDIEAEERPVSLQPGIYGNFDLVGICFAYVESPRPARLRNGLRVIRSGHRGVESDPAPRPSRDRPSGHRAGHRVRRRARVARAAGGTRDHWPDRRTTTLGCTVGAGTCPCGGWWRTSGLCWMSRTGLHDLSLPGPDRQAAWSWTTGSGAGASSLAIPRSTLLADRAIAAAVMSTNTSITFRSDQYVVATPRPTTGIDSPT